MDISIYSYQINYRKIRYKYLQTQSFCIKKCYHRNECRTNILEKNDQNKYKISCSSFSSLIVTVVDGVVVTMPTCPPSPSTLCSSLHSSMVWARSTWQSGTFTSPIWSCFEKRSKSKIANTRVLFMASAYGTFWVIM